MQQVLSTPQDFVITGVQLKKIVFDDSDIISVWVNARVQDSIKFIHLLFSMHQLNDWMRFSGEKGEKTIISMADIMMQSNNPPYVLDIEKLLLNDNVFTTCKLSVQNLNTNGETLCFVVYDVMPINIIQQSKNMATHIKDFGSADKLNSKILHQGFSQLCEQFKYYLGLLELDIKDIAARHKANLQDERMFFMAKNAYQHQQVK